MLAIRLQRVGRKHEPVFRLVLTDSQNGPKSGKFLEILGSYDARQGDKAEIKNDRVLYWMSKGAQASDTVHNMLVNRGVVKGEKKNVLSKRPVSKQAEEAPKTEAPASSEATTEAQIEESADKPQEDRAPEDTPEEKIEEAPATPEADEKKEEVEKQASQE